MQPPVLKSHKACVNSSLSTSLSSSPTNFPLAHSVPDVGTSPLFFENIGAPSQGLSLTVLCVGKFTYNRYQHCLFLLRYLLKYSLVIYTPFFSSFGKMVILSPTSQLSVPFILYYFSIVPPIWICFTCIHISISSLFLLEYKLHESREFVLLNGIFPVVVFCHRHIWILYVYIYLWDEWMIMWYDIWRGCKMLLYF